MELRAAHEQVARVLDLMPHQRDKRRGEPASAEIVFGHPEMREVPTREIDPSLREIDRDVLPEVRQLQPGTDQIRQALPLSIAIAEQIQHQPPDGIGRTARVPAQVLDRLEALKIHVTTERFEQVRKGLAWNRESAGRVGQRDHHRMARRACIGEVQLALPFVELRQATRPVCQLICKVVGDPRIGVNRMHMGTHRPWHQPRRDREVFVVRAGESSAVGVGFREIRRARPDKRRPWCGELEGRHATCHAAAAVIRSRAAMRAQPSTSRRSSSVAAARLS
jgi:hypothetical protein